MAAISSLILNDDQTDTIFSPLPETNTDAKTNSENSQAEPVSQDLLTEILAIQQAMQNETDFDFSKLEPSSAGTTQHSLFELSNEKSTTSPILLDGQDLLIHYRSDENISSTSSKQDNTGSSTQTQTNTFDSSSTLLAENPFQQVQSSVSEDLITHSQGQFNSNIHISAQTVDTKFGSFITDGQGNWQYSLNNQLSEVQSLAAGESTTDTISLVTNSGQKILFNIEINGTNDQAVITGQKLGALQAIAIEDLDNNHPSISGKLNVSDIDSGEARFETNFDIHGNFGIAQINAQGEWSYTLNNNSDAIQGLRSGEKLLDLFSVKTIDGSKQLIQINIEGVDDKPLLSGNNVAVLDLETNSSTSGSLSINDPDFGESSFQVLSGIRSSLGYGTADIDSQGNWIFNLDTDYAKFNTIDEGQTRIDSFEIFTMDGTSQTIHIPIKGSNTPLYAQDDTTSFESQTLSLNDLINEVPHQDDISFALNASFNTEMVTNTIEIGAQEEAPLNNQALETSMYLNSDHDILQTSNTHLNDIAIS